MAKNVMIFSHPNHELAVMGFIRRTRPQLIFLTDGGGENRMNETRQGLEPVVGRDALHFLNHPESALYQALLQKDFSFYASLAAEVSRILQRLAPHAVYCDAIEFYNPVHDISLPVTRAALNGMAAEIFEVPLIYQRNADAESYVLQRAPASLAADCIWIDLTAEEATAKTKAMQDGYRLLSGQLNGTLDQATPDYIRREQFLPARNSLPMPAPEQKLRYEWRGAALRNEAAISDIITYSGHYAPLFEAIVP